MAKRILFVTPLFLFVGLAIYLAFGLTRDARVLPSALIDKPIPEFALPALFPGEPGFATADLKGKVAVVNVFASWCIPCRVEHPVLMRLAEQGVPIYGINYKDKPDDAERWLDRLGDPYTRTGADRDGRVAIDWGVYGVPETFVVDRQGRIVHKHIGVLKQEAFENDIMPLIDDLRK